MTDKAGNIVTSEVRFSFPHLFEPAKAQGAAEAKYSLSLLFPHPSKLSGKALEDYNACITALKAAAQQAAKDKWGDKLPTKLKTPFLDQGDYEYEGYEKGAILIRVTSKQKPGIVDAKVQPIIDSSQIYPGCYGKVSIRAFAYDQNGNRGISFGLQNVQKTRDGESIGGRASPESDFAPVEGGEAAGAEGLSADSLFS
jgi:Protein of unknown function (DUF2815)